MSAKVFIHKGLEPSLLQIAGDQPLRFHFSPAVSFFDYTRG